MSVVLHASAVAVRGRGLLIRGASGAGKSGLALEMMALGATLIADDRVAVRRVGAGLRLSAPAAIRGMIEARGLGLLHAPSVEAVALAAVLDLDRAETERLPPERRCRILGVEVALLHNPASPHLSAALTQYLTSGRKA